MQPKLGLNLVEVLGNVFHLSIHVESYPVTIVLVYT